MKGRITLFVSSLLFLSNAFSACNDALTATTPTSRFEVDQANVNIVMDKESGLRWARCPYSYQWDDSVNACVHDGSTISTYTWYEVLKYVKDNPVYLNEQGWRLPNIKELASLIELKCSNPSINTSIFKGSYPGDYWSNSHVVGSGSYVRIVNFYAGEVVTKLETSEAYLRLVKDADNTAP
ncbi:MAG: DUF1566 domain-containing protein [Gammaproteobacteria bacterium]|nr:DUF1566 domain-containing protein [Gammaproteobacteria bacterium]